MKDRIKTLRKELGLTQTEFGERIGVKGNTITNYETGLRNPSEAVITSLIREFKVNEIWLRFGNGDMFAPQKTNEEITNFMGDVIVDPDDSFRRRFITMLSKLSPEEWALLAKMAKKLEDDA